MDITGSAAGMHIVAWLPRLSPDRVPALIAECAHRGVGVYSIAAHSAAAVSRAGLLIGYGLTDPDAIRRGVALLSEAYRAIARPGMKRKRH